MGNLYNMLFGVNPATFYILPMLGKHPDEYPRYRDCFVNEENQIVVMTRVGGNNRKSGYGEEELYKHPNYVSTYDDESDNTYGYYVFSVPEKWKDDFHKIMTKQKPSEEYIDCMCNIYTKIADKIRNQFDELNADETVD